MLVSFLSFQMILVNRFDGEKFLERNAGKKIMFVGDSISNNMWQSLTCLLHIAVPSSNYTLSRTNELSVFSFPVIIFSFVSSKIMSLANCLISITDFVLCFYYYYWIIGIWSLNHVVEKWVPCGCGL